MNATDVAGTAAPRPDAARARSEAPATLPGREPAALEGDLARFGAAEVLHWLRWAQASGRVEFERAGERIGLQLQAGRLLNAGSDGRSVRTGEVLVHRHQVTPQMLAVALSSQRERGGRIGERLIEDGAAEPEHVRCAIEECARRVVFRLLLWSEGRFRFVPDARWAEGAVPIDVDLEQLVIDGLRIEDAARAGSP